MTVAGGRPFAPVTYVLLLLNGLAFAFELSLGQDLDAFLYRWGTVPRDWQDFLSGAHSSPGVLITLLSALFLHAGWVHLVANMLYLWCFGERVERALGSGSLLTLYLCAGFLGSLGQMAANLGAQIPAIGASGAVSGVIGAYLALQPGSTAAALAPRMFYRRSVDLSAALLLALWLGGQALVGTLAIADAAQFGGVGWWAHLGGFCVGLGWGLMVVYLKKGAGWPALRPANPFRPAGGPIEGVEEPQHEWGRR